jgi:hypothetical protein
VLLWKALEGFSHGWSQGNACPKQWTTAGKTQGNFSMDFLRECPSWSSMMFSGIEGYSAIVSPALETCCDKAGHIFSWSLSALSGCMHPENSCGSAKLNPKLQIQLVSHIGRWFFSLSLTVIKKFHRKNRSGNLQQSHHSGKKTSNLARITVYLWFFHSLFDLSLWIVINGSTRPPTCPVWPPLGPVVFPPPTSLSRGGHVAETEVRFLLKKAKLGSNSWKTRCR